MLFTHQPDKPEEQATLFTMERMGGSRMRYQYITETDNVFIYRLLTAALEGVGPWGTSCERSGRLMRKTRDKILI